MPLPNITPKDFALVLPELLSGEHTTDDLNDALRIVTVLPADEIKTTLLEGIRARRKTLHESAEEIR